MTTETLHDKAIRLAKEAGAKSELVGEMPEWSMLECQLVDLVRLAQQEALEDAAKEFDHKDAPANGKPWVANALRKIKGELK